jgi:hypothetical protein
VRYADVNISPYASTTSVTGIWRIHTIVQGMADRGMVEVQVRRNGNMVRVPRHRRGESG